MEKIKYFIIFLLKLTKGETVAIVGHSGAGKSTIADLLVRFYDVNEGQIKIDNVDIKDIGLTALRKIMGVVTQESILFNDSVINNIGLGINNIDRNRVIEATKMANAHGFIENLENKYDTIIGDGGNKLSGGQKQKSKYRKSDIQKPRDFNFR